MSHRAAEANGDALMQSRALNQLGLLVSDINKLDHDLQERAIQHFQRAAQLDPTNYVAYYNWGLAAEGQGRWDAALTQFLRVLELHPTFASAILSVGNIMFRKHQLAEALEFYMCVRAKAGLYEIQSSTLTMLCWWNLLLHRSSWLNACFMPPYDRGFRVFDCFASQAANCPGASPEEMYNAHSNAASILTAVSNGFEQALQFLDSLGPIYGDSVPLRFEFLNVQVAFFAKMGVGCLFVAPPSLGGFFLCAS